MNYENFAACPLGGREDSFPVPRFYPKSIVRNLTDTTETGTKDLEKALPDLGIID